MILRRPPPRRTRTYRIRDAEWQLIISAAALMEVDPSSFVRQAAVEAARRELTRASEPDLDLKPGRQDHGD